MKRFFQYPLWHSLSPVKVARKNLLAWRPSSPEADRWRGVFIPYHSVTKSWDADHDTAVPFNMCISSFLWESRSKLAKNAFIMCLVLKWTWKKYCKDIKEGESICSLNLDTDVFYAGFWKKLEKFALFLSFRHLSQLQWPFKDNQEWVYNDIEELSTCGYISWSPMDLWVSSFFKMFLSLVILYWVQICFRLSLTF